MPDPAVEPAYRRKPEFFEHRMAQFPDLVFVCPRCKTSLVYAPHNSGPACFRCSNQEPGRVYVSLEALLPILAQITADTDTDMLPRAERLMTWIKERAEAMGQPMQPGIGGG